MNTIIYDNEMDDMLQLVRELEKAKVDALLIQDMGLLKACKEQLKTNISLHASTQCDSRTAEKVRWLASLGFERVVLARELSVQEIADITYGCARSRVGSLCTWGTLCELQRHLLCFPILFRPLSQSWSVCPVLQNGIRFERF